MKHMGRNLRGSACYDVYPITDTYYFICSMLIAYQDEQKATQ